MKNGFIMIYYNPKRKKSWTDKSQPTSTSKHYENLRNIYENKILYLGI